MIVAGDRLKDATQDQIRFLIKEGQVVKKRAEPGTDGMKRAALLIATWFAIAQPAYAAPGDDIYTRPGILAPAGDGARLNLVCLGKGSPAVVFDSGFLDWAPAWATVQPAIARFTRNCSYDRAGSGFSGPGPLPRTTERIATELHDALHSAGIQGPYILVGHAFGGDHVRAFADLFPEEVAGLVLVEADPSEMDTAANRLADDRGLLSYVPKLKACRNGIAAGNPDFALPPPAGRPPRPCARGFFRGLPEPQWSSDLNAKLLDIAGHKVAMWDSDVSELQEVPADKVWLEQHRRYLGATPVRILTTGNHGVQDLDRKPPPTIDHLKMEYDVALAQSRWLTLSSNSRQIFVSKSGEYVQLDQPDAVVNVVHEIFDGATAAAKRGTDR